MPVPDRDTKASQYHPVECAVNMLLARVAFDVLRNPDVKQKLIAHIHRKVNELRFPSYIHGIEVSTRPSALHLIRCGTTNLQ